MEGLLFYPVLTLVALTLGIGYWLGRQRWLAVARGDLSVEFYELNRGGEMPDYLRKVHRNYNNLLELPLLFYVGTGWAFAAQAVDPLMLGVAWAFVATRVVHSAIHITYNDVRHRSLAFLLGVAFLTVLWLDLVVQLARP